jgi:hypothetical protein
MHLNRSVDNVERYKVAKKTAKRVVSEARGQMYNGLYQRLGTKEGEKDIYRMAKSRERKTRDIIQVKCIKDATEQLLTKDEDIKNRWGSILTNSSKTVGARALSYTSLHMTSTDNLCVGFKNLRSKMP